MTLDKRCLDGAKKQTPRVLPEGPRYGHSVPNAPDSNKAYDKTIIYENTSKPTTIPLSACEDVNRGTGKGIGKMIEKTKQVFTNIRKPFPKAAKRNVIK